MVARGIKPGKLPGEITAFADIEGAQSLNYTFLRHLHSEPLPGSDLNISFKAKLVRNIKP